MLVALASCGEIEPDPPVDEDGDVIPLPGPYDTFLDIEDVQPAPGLIAPDSPIEIRFQTWLDDDRIINAAAAALASGGVRTGGYARYVMTRRSLYWTPYGESIPGLRYALTLDQQRIWSVTGAPPDFSTLPTYRIATDGERLPLLDLSPVRWARVDAILEANCRSCHSDPRWQLNPLTRESLLGAPSEQVDRLLVRPGDAADSYLMEKIIPNYPRRQYTVQPPPWSGLSPLPEDEILTIERWIIAGAPP